MVNGPLNNMHTKHCIIHFLIAITWSMHCLSIGDPQGWKQVKGLKEAMYAEMNYGQACVKLLTSSGPQGCEAPGGNLVTAPLVHVDDFDRIEYKGQRVVVVPAVKSDAFLSKVLADAQLRSRVAGVLVDPTAGRPQRQSLAEKFPSSAYALYDNRSYEWNPSGTAFTRQYFGMPIYMLTASLAKEVNRGAAYNADKKFRGGRHIARMELPMMASGNSSECITDQTCLPVGGYIVWTAVPRLPDPTYERSPRRNITLVLAPTDSDGMFHDLLKAAGTSVSGLTAAVAALTLLMRYGSPESYTRQLVFAALPGEGFDYLGSKRLLYEMHRYNLDRTLPYVQGLELDLIDQVVEVGQIGSAWDRRDNTSALYLHVQRTGGYGSADTLVHAATEAAAPLSPRVQVLTASASNPGLPPSSLMSFLRIKPSISGLVITDFDSSFKNPYYHSEFDDGFNTTTSLAEAMVDATLVLAAMLHSLAAAPGSPPFELNRTVAAGVVEALASCTLTDVPGLDCPLARQLINPEVRFFEDGTASYGAYAYPGVLNVVMNSSKLAPGSSSLPRFLYNYLGNLTGNVNSPSTNNGTSNSGEGAECKPLSNGSNCMAPYVCIGWRNNKDGMGRCLNTTTNYLPAYSTRLVFGPVEGRLRWSVNDNAREADWEGKWPNDSMWTESNWPPFTPTLKVYQHESDATQAATLVVGLLLTVLTAAVSWAGLKVFEGHFKML